MAAMRRVSCMSMAAVMVSVCGLPVLARADLPPVMDRLPTDSAVVVVIRNLDTFSKRVDGMMKSLGAEDGPQMVLADMAGTPGLDASGSIAVVMATLPSPEAQEGGQEPPFVVLVPVKDFNAFASALGGDAAGDVREIEIEGENMFARNLGDGYAAMSPDKDVLVKFTPAKGKAAEFRKAMGAGGARIGDKADVLLVANMATLAPMFKQGMGEFEKNTANMAQMGGPAAGMVEMLTTMQKTMSGMVDDAQSGIVGVGLDDAGVTLDMAMQFREGTASYTTFSMKGNAHALAGKLPAAPYLFAWSADLSSPAAKNLVRGMMDFSTKAAAAQPDNGMQDMMSIMGSNRAMLEKIDTIDGFAMTIGYTPALMAGGLFANTVQVISTSDPAGYTGAMKQLIEGMNAKQIGQTKLTSSYKPGAVDASGVKVDSWNVTMQMDPNDPNAMQMQQGTMMLFGMSGGPNGLVGTTDKAVVLTMSQNAPLMTQALESAKSGKGLTADQATSDVAATLPADRVVEMYLGTKSIIDTVVPFMAMMGAAAPIQSPPSLPPVGMAITGSGGGMGFTMHVPMPVIKTVAEIVGKMQEGGEEAEPMEEAPAEEGGKPPRF